MRELYAELCTFNVSVPSSYLELKCCILAKCTNYASSHYAIPIKSVAMLFDPLTIMWIVC